MNSTAVLIAVSYSVVVVIGAAIFLVVWRSTNSAKEVDTTKMAHREKAWLVIVVCLLLGLLFATIFFTPYGQSAPADAQNVDVTAQQFAFSPIPTLRAGRPVAFHLRSKDVNHGFGLYTADDEFILQAQIVPDYETTVVHTFDKPGTYKVVCLEYCGLNHHGMIEQFRVVR